MFVRLFFPASCVAADNRPCLGYRDDELGDPVEEKEPVTRLVTRPLRRIKVSTAVSEHSQLHV